MELKRQKPGKSLSYDFEQAIITKLKRKQLGESLSHENLIYIIK